MKKWFPLTLSLLIFGSLSIGLYWINKSPKSSKISVNPEKNLPLGLPAISWPSDNPYTENKAELGRILYFDKRLSSDGTIACASCHRIQDGFADPSPTSTGIENKKGTRNSPTVINTAYLTHLFWDGRASSLEEQAKGPIANPSEMTLVDDIHQAHNDCEKRIAMIPGYRPLFKAAFGDDKVTMQRISQAIATFERTVLSGNSSWDRYMAGDDKAYSKEEIDGLRIFKRSNCGECHSGFNFTDGKFSNIGVGMDKEEPDLGRYDITKDKKDWGAFKTPTLRDVSHTAPYMHDGSLATLEEVIDYYDKGGIPNVNLDPRIKPLHLTPYEKKALLSFLHSLDGHGWQDFKEPEELPQ